jgi:DNA-binding transcriptional LysR family regulator
MEIREIRSFMTLAELGSLTQTAQKLHLSPGAIHKQIKVLESELDVRLYEKMGRRVALTQPAKVLLPYVRDLLARYDATIEAMEELKGLKRGVVHIGAGPTISSYVLPSLLKKFRRRFPNIDLVVETGNTITLIEGLTKGSTDLAMLIPADMPEEEGLSVETSWDFEIVVVSNLPRAPRACSISELQKFPFILWQKGSRVENLIDRYTVEVGLRPRVIMRFDNAEAIKAMIRAGMGISMLPYWAVDSDLKRRALSSIHLTERPLLSKIVLVTRASGYVANPVAAFLEVARNFEFRNPRMMSPHTFSAMSDLPSKQVTP